MVSRFFSLFVLVFMFFNIEFCFARTEDNRAIIPTNIKKPIEERFVDYSRLLSGEKLYLHTDREVYNVGDTVWIKGYLRNASRLSEFKECNYIYVEIISSMWEMSFVKGKPVLTDRVRKRVKIKRDSDGSFIGYLPLDEDVNTGLATIRAYSYWMMNSDLYTLYHKNIEIRNPMKDHFAEVLKKGEVDDPYVYQEYGMDNPFKKELFKVNSKRETDLDIQFLPESGAYVYGCESVIGVKALNGLGMGVKIHGKVFADDRELSSFSTNDMGMGCFRLMVPSGTRKLKAVCESEIESFEYEVDLPSPKKSSVVINLSVADDCAEFVVRNVDVRLPDSVYVVIYDKEQITHKSLLVGNCVETKVKYAELHNGINNVAVVDDKGNVYAQRPFFVYPDKKSTVLVESDKLSYGKREKISLLLNLTDDEGAPIKGDFSLSVTDAEYAPYSGDGHNIASYFYLGSELQGYVEKPQYYFNDSIPISQRRKDLDCLLMTQGWKYYDLEKILKEQTIMPRFGREYTQSISGYVLGVIGKARHSLLCFVAQSIGYSQIADLDSTAYFALNGLDFPDGTQFLVGAQGKRGLLKKWYTPVLAPEYYPAMYKHTDYLTFRGYDQAYANNAIQSYSTNGGTLSYMLTPSRIIATRNISPYPDDSFRPDQYRGEKALVPYADLDIVTYIATTCPGVRISNGQLVSYKTAIGSNMQRGSSKMPVLIYLNGFPATQKEIEGYMVSELEAFAIVSGNGAAKYQIASSENLDYTLSPRVTVFLKTKFPVRGASNVITDRPMGWIKPAAMYEPKYDTPESKKIFEPMRPTIHWDPKIEVENGKAFVNFYTSDHNGPYLVIVEGISDRGDFIFQTKFINK